MDDTYYTGSTVDLDRRLSEHQNCAGANYTKKRLPVQLVYFEEYSRIDEAFYREKQVQGWCRKKKEALINGTLNDLHFLAECKNSSHFRNIGGFDSAQPPVSAQPPASVREALNRSLSGAETTSEEVLVKELEREKRLIKMAMEENEL